MTKRRPLETYSEWINRDELNRQRKQTAKRLMVAIATIVCTALWLSVLL